MEKIEKSNKPTRATITNPIFEAFCELGKSLKYSLRTTFKNPSFECKDELKNAMSQFEFHC